MDPVLRKVNEHAARQDGCITTAHCRSLGMSGKRISWLVRNGHWQRLHHGVYLTSSGPPTWRQRARAALLYAGPHAVLSHRAAGYVQGLVVEPPRVIEVSIPVARRARPSAGARIIRRRTVPPSRGWLPATELEHTVVDLLDQARTIDDAFGIVVRALRRGAAPWEVRDVISTRRRLRRRRLVHDLFDEAQAGIESPLERRYHHDVERAHGLPRSQLQARSVLGGRLTRADRLYDAFGLRIELDGRLAHDDPAQDAWRDNSAVVERDEITLRYRWIHVVAMACRTAAQVVVALRRRGWTGSPRACGPGCQLSTALATHTAPARDSQPRTSAGAAP